MNYQQATDYLFSRHAKGMKLGLKNIKALLSLLDHPEDSFKAVHIAGTNGKGSTAAMMDSILRKAGYKTGLYTSPHLIDMSERMRINGVPISQQEIVNYTKAIQPHADQVNATFFEILTAMAFCYFRDQKIDIAILETGLGGRLDATKMAHPIISIITNIDLEHTNILGDTLEKIAYEKAGILKKNIPCVVGSKNNTVKDFYQTFCEANQIPLHIVDDLITLSNSKYDLKGTLFSVETPYQPYHDITLSMLGTHQIDNATTSLIAIEQLRQMGWTISDDAIRQGFQSAQWDGRLQILQKNPMILLDSAHNLMGIQSLAKMLEQNLYGKRLILMFGLLQDKNYKAMAEAIAPLADHIILTEPINERALPANELAKLECFKNKNVKTIRDIDEAFNYSRQLCEPDHCLCITGSLYLIGEVLRLWKRYQNVI